MNGCDTHEQLILLTLSAKTPPLPQASSESALASGVLLIGTQLSSDSGAKMAVVASAIKYEISIISDQNKLMLYMILNYIKCSKIE